MSLDKIIFLNSLPRAGNTLLGAVLNKNKNIKATPNSITVDGSNENKKIVSSVFEPKRKLQVSYLNPKNWF